MTSSSPAEEIFFAALGKRTPEDRAAYLDEACRDAPDLRRRVERLLDAHLQAGDFLEQPPAEIRATVDRPADDPADDERDNLLGSSIGPYKLLERIGEGGMGVVYMADQQEPVRRRVALKIIKPGMDTRQIVARFEAERQALAMMDHLHIARILDAGTTDSGHPYFVMELVRGIPITDYCDQNNLAIHERLELLIHVCHAVQHAHQKGIIHRDLKPSNVLVTLYDGRAVPKVIDFGVAKALNQQLTDKTLFTNFAQMIGTPLYMSPEQAEISGLDVDTRADVYSLGVLLYELLTGTTPFDRGRLRDAAFEEVRRIIREEEPERPSTRISTLGQQRTAIAAHRQADANRLSQLVRGDLDWIVMKSLEKDRTRRYETIGGLAQDLQRYLSDQPVEACPPSTVYRFRKFARRNRAALATAAVLVAALALGAATSTWQAVRATRAEQVAEAARATEAKLREQEQVARQQAEAARKESDQQREAVETQKQHVERMLYAAEIGRAQANWDSNNVRGAWEVLEACPDKLRGWEHDYLYTLFTSAHVTIKAPHSTDLISPDCRWFAGTSYETVQGKDVKAAKIWDLASGRGIATIEGQTSMKDDCVKFSPDGRSIAAWTADGIMAWDTATGKLLRAFPAKNVGNLQFTPDGRRIAGAINDEKSDGKVVVWSMADGREELMITTMKRASDENARLSVAFSPDGMRIASGPWDHLIKVWDASNGEELFALEGRIERVNDRQEGANDLAFSPDGRQITRVASDGKIKVWDASSGRETITILVAPLDRRDIIPLWPTHVAFSPDSRRIAANDDDGTIHVWDATQLFYRDVVRTPEAEDGDGTFDWTDATTANDVLTLKGNETQVTGVKFTPDGRQIVTPAADGTVAIWDAVRGQLPLTLPPRHEGKKSGAGSVAFTPDGRRIVTDTGEKTLVVWDALSGEKLLTLGHTGATCCLAISADGRLIGGGSNEGQNDGVLKIWDADNGHELRTIEANSGTLRSVAFSRNGQWIASGSWGGNVKLFNSHTGAEFWARKSSYGCYVAFSPDGTQLASGMQDGAIVLWDVATGNQLREIKADKYGVACVAFSPDGCRIASGGSVYDGSTIKVWDLASGQEIFSVRGHARDVEAVAFSPDGRRIASGSRDSTVKIWDADTGQELHTLRDDDGDIDAVAFSPDGKRLASANSVLGVRIWEATRHQQAKGD